MLRALLDDALASISLAAFPSHHQRTKGRFSADTTGSGTCASAQSALDISKINKKYFLIDIAYMAAKLHSGKTHQLGNNPKRLDFCP